MLSNLWTYVYLFWVWPMWKWTLRQVTGQCELLRISYKSPPGATRTKATESSLKCSKSQELKRVLMAENINIDEAVNTIMNIKSVSQEVHPQFGPVLRMCLCQICGYRELVTEVEAERRVPYSSENVQHEEQLLSLWQQLRPDEPLTARISKQWTDIGFQGDDPMTDFRGMGLLGLRNLLYFVSEHTQAALQMVSRSSHPQCGYSFAIVGINITGLTYQLLTSGHLKTHFYNAVLGQPQLNDFHQVYSYLLYQFDQFWFAEKPRDIMEFNRIKDKFQKTIVNKLQDKSTTLMCKESQRCIYATGHLLPVYGSARDCYC